MRYALYYAPLIDSAFWRAGCSWLGQDAAHDLQVVQPSFAGVSADELAAITTRAARYGWHATLKAPFALREGVCEAQLLAQTSALAATFQPFDVYLQVERLGAFLALRPPVVNVELNELAHACVVALEPLADRSLPPKSRAGLDLRQQQLQARWGYPYVFEHYRFHLTLTDPLQDEAQAARLQQAAMQHFSRFARIDVSGIAVFAETSPGAAFRYLAYCGFDGKVVRHDG